MESLILIRGPCAPMEPLAEKMYIRNEYLSIANCVFKFNFLSLVVSKITGGPKLTLGRALRPLDAPSGKFLIKRVLYHGISNGIFKFKFLALVVSEKL